MTGIVYTEYLDINDVNVLNCSLSNSSSSPNDIDWVLQYENGTVVDEVNGQQGLQIGS